MVNSANVINLKDIGDIGHPSAETDKDGGGVSSGRATYSPLLLIVLGEKADSASVIAACPFTYSLSLASLSLTESSLLLLLLFLSLTEAAILQLSPLSPSLQSPAPLLQYLSVHIGTTTIISTPHRFYSTPKTVKSQIQGKIYSVKPLLLVT